MKKRLLYALLIVIGLLVALFFLVNNNISLVSPVTQQYYSELKSSLRTRGYSPKLLVISTKRPDWLNQLLVRFNGAANNSQHLPGNAIDFLVFDVNGNGSSNAKDVEIVYQILDKEIIGDKGGLGTYKNSGCFFNRQMIHIDCRGRRARINTSMYKCLAELKNLKQGYIVILPNNRMV